MQHFKRFIEFLRETNNIEDVRANILRINHDEESNIFTLSH